MNSSSKWIAVPALLVALTIYAACGGMQAPRPAGTPEDAECMVSAGAEVVCGYHCMMASGGVIKCADTRDGSCSRTMGGDVTCTQMAESTPTPEPETTPAPTPTDPPSDGSANAQTDESSTYCCVNGAYHSCPDAGEAAVCVGEPMQLMSCVQNCPMMGSGGCEEECIASHGPRPQDSQCKRDPSRDAECPRN